MAAYRVAYASSEDPEAPASELLQSPGPASSASRQGWASSRNCEYPQSLILELNAATSLRQIQFLSHQSKIATKLELFVSMDADVWKRLGYLSLDSNERSNFMARELKSVFVDTGTFRFLKLLLHRPHLNKLNPHNQVSLVGIFLEISLPAPAPLASQPLPFPTASATAVAAPKAATNFGASEAASEVSARIADLQRRKTAAAQAENFDEAKRLKAEIENLEISVRAVRELEERKQRAVDAEDFDTAKALKSEISRLKATLGLASSSRPPSEAPRFLPSEGGEGLGGFGGSRGPLRGTATEPQTQASGEGDRKFPISLDEVPAVARGDALREFMHFREISDPQQEQEQHPLENCGVEDFRALPRPGPLATAALLEHETLLEIFGEYVVACAVSRDWKLREAGLGKISSEIENISVSHKVMAGGFVPLLVKTSDEKNPQAFAAAATLAMALVPNFRLHLKRQGESEILLDRLLERVGDANRKISDHAAAVLVALGTEGMQTVGNFVLKNLRTKNLARLAPKTLAAKLAVAAKTIGNSEEDAVLGISIAVECVKTQASVEGRQAGVALLKRCMEISSNFRSLLDPYLADLRPQQRDHLFLELFPSPPIRPTSVRGQSAQAGHAALLSSRVAADGRCQFCGERSDKFASDGAALDAHYLKECPALVECELCHQIVEKTAITDHIDSFECQPLANNPI